MNKSGGCCEKAGQYVNFALRFKQAYIDEIADKLQITDSISIRGITMPFDKRLSEQFNAFSDR